MAQNIVRQYGGQAAFPAPPKVLHASWGKLQYARFLFLRSKWREIRNISAFSAE